jgi:hypothetical protein
MGTYCFQNYEVQNFEWKDCEEDVIKDNVEVSYDLFS